LKSPKSPIQLIEEIIRAKTALHLRLVAHRNDGEMDIGGKSICELIAEVGEGILRLTSGCLSISRTKTPPKLWLRLKRMANRNTCKKRTCPEGQHLRSESAGFSAKADKMVVIYHRAGLTKSLKSAGFSSVGNP
jgi:hypothetical protein